MQACPPTRRQDPPHFPPVDSSKCRRAGPGGGAAAVAESPAPAARCPLVVIYYPDDADLAPMARRLPRGRARREGAHLVLDGREIVPWRSDGGRVKNVF